MFRSMIMIIGAILMACKSTPKIDNFNTKAWQEDRMGCKGQRKSQEKELNAIKEQLKGLSQEQIFELLGNPDIQKLHDHNQKFFVYYIEGGKCDTKNVKPRIINIRFSAIGIVTEVMIENGVADVERGF